MKTLTEKAPDRRTELQSEAQFRLLVQGVTDYAIYMLSTEGHVSSWNAGAERIKGYSADEIIGHHFSRFYLEEDRTAGLPEKGLAIAAREGRFEREGYRVRKDGTRFLAHVVIDAIHDDSGRLIGFAKITRDITERQRAQEALHAAQQVFFQAQKLESIGQLTGGIAHDFNNLLTAVMASLELLKPRLQGDVKGLGLLDNALQGTERGAILTQRMLAFARRQELSIRPVNLGALLQGMMGLIERSVGPLIRISTDVAADLADAKADANQLEAAILNLIVNARDAMAGGGTITIGAHEEMVVGSPIGGIRSGKYVCLWVRDEGSGMDANTLARATEPFFTTKGIGKGTGLGLSMVHGLAEQFGGTTRIESQLNHGTIITILLPASDENEVAVINTPVSEPVQCSAVGLRILVVDDDPLVLRSTAGLLEIHGHDVVQAMSGLEALKFLTQHPFDVLVTDQMMPEMTGLQLAAAAAALAPGLPIVLATGFADIPEGIPANVRRLPKPYRGADLLSALKAVTGQK